MTPNFTYETSPSRIIFGSGKRHGLKAELDNLNCKRALILSTPQQKEQVAEIADELKDQCVGHFSDATMHTPVDITNRAIKVYDEENADCIISVGGGSTIGLGKAIAYRNDALQFVVPTTYAGSEVTPILGQTENGLKTTVRGPSILPEVVIYDPELTLGLPVSMSVSSGLNAIAHAVEAMYAQNRNPISSMMAVDGTKALKEALPLVVMQPDDIDARTKALYGSWLCGTVLGAVGMALHHKLCHTLGGSFNMPHAETHAILLPHTAAYNEAAASKELEPLIQMFGGNLGQGLYDLAAELNAPLALGDFGLNAGGVERASKIAVQNPYWNPREITQDGIHTLLTNALIGIAPSKG